MRNLIEHFEAGELPRVILTSRDRKSVDGFLQFLLKDNAFKTYLDELTYVTDSSFYSGGDKIVDTDMAVNVCCIHRVINDPGFLDYYYKMCGRVLLERRQPVEVVITSLMDTYFTSKASAYAVNLHAVH